MRHLLFLFAATLAAQDGRMVISTQVHQYSGISPLSVNMDQLHVMDPSGHASIVKVADGSVIATDAPYPEGHWDNVDNDLMYVVRRNGQNTSPQISTWRPSTGIYTTYIDYTGVFKSIITGSTADITYDNWFAFWAQTEHTLCAVDLTAQNTYCLDVNAPDPLNHLPLVTPSVDWVAATPRDSMSGLHYVVMMATPAMGVFSVDEAAGVLRWVVRPETVFPWMGAKGNGDGNCDPGESCLTTPHADILTAADGQVYLSLDAGIEADALSICQEGRGLLRLNAGALMTRAENLAGVTGGGMKYAGPDFFCGGYQVWSATHIGCNRWGGHCMVSFDTPKPTTQTGTPKKNELWLLSTDSTGTPIYTKLGVSSTSYVNAGPNADANYWSSSRAAMSMDGTQVIYDSDASTNGATHNVYEKASGCQAVSLGDQPVATSEDAIRGSVQFQNGPSGKRFSETCISLIQ